MTGANGLDFDLLDSKIKSTQGCLKALGLYGGKIDGDFGPQSNLAAKSFLERLDIALIGVGAPKISASQLRIIGIRMTETFSDTFDDILVRLGDPALPLLLVPGTTDAGNFYIKNKLATYRNVTGTFAIKEGHYPDLWQFHRETWWLENQPFFSPVSNCKGYRDNNKNSVLDRTMPVQEVGPDAGIMCHTMGAGNVIYNYSAGCQGAPLKFWKWFIEPFKHMEKYSYSIVNRGMMKL